MASPFRIGILNDTADGPPSPAPPIEPWVRLAIDEVTEQGRLDREVEILHSWGLGLPEGTAATVERTYGELADAGVLLIVGPAIGDDALVATPLADRFGVPTINWAGSERARSDYMFHLQVGSHEDESIVIARYLAGAGVRRAGVVYDRSPIGRRHLAFLQAEAEVLGLVIAASVSVVPLAADVQAEVATVADAGVDGLVYLGLGLSSPAVAQAVVGRGWTGTRIMNAAGMRGYDPTFADAIDGWIYVDVHSDENQTLAALRTRTNVPGSVGPSPAYGYDLGRLAAEALARATERTRDGVKEGLEQIKWLPAAQGHEGTLLGFGHHDRGALHGRYLVVRQWQQRVSVEL